MSQLRKRAHKTVSRAAAADAGRRRPNRLRDLSLHTSISSLWGEGEERGGGGKGRQI